MFSIKPILNKTGFHCDFLRRKRDILSFLLLNYNMYIFLCFFISCHVTTRFVVRQPRLWNIGSCLPPTRDHVKFRHYYFHFYYYSLIIAFHISRSRWFFTGVWVTASLLKSPGLFLVFWPFSIVLSFGWSPLVCQLPSPPVPFVIL